MVCVGGGIAVNRLVGASACCVFGLVSGGGGGGGGVGLALLVVGGGRGWVLRVRAVRSCGPWLVAVPRYGWEAAAWACGRGCGP